VKNCMTVIIRWSAAFGIKDYIIIGYL